jgi:hypothetical protein
MYCLERTLGKAWAVIIYWKGIYGEGGEGFLTEAGKVLFEIRGE